MYILKGAVRTCLPPPGCLSREASRLSTLPTLSDTMYLLISFRKSTPPQNRQLNILIGNSKRSVDEFVGELTFKNSWLNTFCEIRLWCKSVNFWANRAYQILESDSNASEKTPLLSLHPWLLFSSHTKWIEIRFAELNFPTKLILYCH